MSAAYKEISVKDIQEAVIRDLKNYKALKVKLENIRERKEASALHIFPVLKRNESIDELKAKQIERAINDSLDPIERKIIEYKYLNINSRDMTDLEIHMELGLKKGKYYIKKKEAIFQLAKALGII
ncbi:ArpU family phage packaging/lysis transcriptional regulator [Ornithinibacillus xuwenensis]|uniref:ArpU family phage packaging/lysis transcriptional regulator n=1 Tax=Ornithinibacillus xuwenensis TaxID=3144668 RepID=A0ABU9XBN2_9BACI